jgi:hypothetical protein
MTKRREGALSGLGALVEVGEDSGGWITGPEMAVQGTKAMSEAKQFLPFTLLIER